MHLSPQIGPTINYKHLVNNMILLVLLSCFRLAFSSDHVSHLIPSSFAPANVVLGDWNSTTPKERRRQERKQRKASAKNNNGTGLDKEQHGIKSTFSDGKIARLLKNPDNLFKTVARIDRLYEETLDRPAPFMTFVICGMQSSGKSTIMERFLNAPLNIVQEGTGTRCPLHTTVIHDSALSEPVCELSGKELDQKKSGSQLTTVDVFAAITEHNRKLAKQDRFSTEPLHLVYRANNVQTMRFVDTPGIISNQGIGRDNREDIKRILRDVMQKPNSKLCVLVEPKEFSTNPIIDFCDETFGGRRQWTDDAIVLMTKFDKHLGDARSGSKTNRFFTEYHENNLFPHLVITPTLAREDISPDYLFHERKELLESASDYEETKFSEWQHVLQLHRKTDPSDPKLLPDITNRLGFNRARDRMREMLLADTVSRLGDVLTSLRKEHALGQEELRALGEKYKFMDPMHVRLVAKDILPALSNRIHTYINGDIKATLNLGHHFMDLDDELNEEEESEWYYLTLGKRVSTEKEEEWRQVIQKTIDDKNMPDHVHAGSKLLGGKQFQRAIDLLKSTMGEALPDINELKDHVANGVGYSENGLLRENWEKATLSIVQVAAEATTHPGVNFFLKHVGSVFRNLFEAALADMKKKSTETVHLLEVCPQFENYVRTKFEEMVWLLMEDAVEKIHISLEPLYSCLDPTMQTLHDDTLRIENTLIENSLIDNEVAKEILRSHGEKQSNVKNVLLPEARTSRITSDEIDTVISYVFRYVFSLLDQIKRFVHLAVNRFVLDEFKAKVLAFPLNIDEEDWTGMISYDSTLEVEISEKKYKVAELQNAIVEVENMQV